MIKICLAISDDENYECVVIEVLPAKDTSFEDIVKKARYRIKWLADSLFNDGNTVTRKHEEET